MKNNYSDQQLEKNLLAATIV